MDKTKKYELPENEPQMAGEAVPVEMVQHKIPIILGDMQGNEECTEDFGVPSLQIPVDELKERIEKGIEDYHNGIYFTQEEVDALMKHWTEGL